MMNKRRKVTKYRGSKTHGCGSMKKRRGAGSRGGRGNAGSGKKGDVKKPSFWKDHPHVGKVGFTSKKQNKEKVINVFELAKHGSEVDLGKLGYHRLLGRGNVFTSIKVTVPRASNKAIQKIEKAKGTVTVTSKSEE